MVKKEFGGGRPFARIFACNLSLRDMVFQVPLSRHTCNFLNLNRLAPVLLRRLASTGADAVPAVT